MAHIYVGDVSRIDQEVLAAVKALPRDFWIYAEFAIPDRNVDWFITRESTDRSSVLILTELKHLARPLQGDGENSIWSTMLPTGELQEIEPSNARDVNYYWQSVNTANALADWLWNNQQRYRDGMDVRVRDDFKVWPDLLLLSGPGTRHRLPLGPSNRYGRWWYDLSSWLQHLETWTPKKGVALAGPELAKLGDALGLRPLPLEEQDEELPGPADVPGQVHGFVAWLCDLERRVERVEAQLQALQSQGSLPAPLAMTPRTNGASVTLLRSSVEVLNRPWTEPERIALSDAVADLRQQGKNRLLPTVLEAMNVKLGYRLQDRAYNGFGTAKAMFDRARADQFVKFGPYGGPNPTIYLAEEEVPLGE